MAEEPEEDIDPEVARLRLLELLESDVWEFTKRARIEGKLVLRWIRDREPTDAEMVEYVIALLKTGRTLRCVPQGNPPGSTGIAWQLTDERNTFVKLRIEGGFGQEHREEFARIQSIHESVHPK